MTRHWVAIHGNTLELRGLRDLARGLDLRARLEGERIVIVTKEPA